MVHGKAELIGVGGRLVEKCGFRVMIKARALLEGDWWCDVLPHLSSSTIVLIVLEICNKCR